jgi:hypothetical protein
MAWATRPEAARRQARGLVVSPRLSLRASWCDDGLFASRNEEHNAARDTGGRGKPLIVRSPSYIGRFSRSASS